VITALKKTMGRQILATLGLAVLVMVAVGAIGYQGSAALSGALSDIASDKLPNLQAI
jgi:hypothetical protein